MKIFVFTKRHQNLLLGTFALLAAVIVFSILAQFGIGIPCLFHRLTGLLCPGCGNSRAALALLRLDFAAAFGYNPLFLLEFFYILWVLLHCVKNYLQGRSFAYKPLFPWLDRIVLALILLWWPIRNLI